MKTPTYTDIARRNELLRQATLRAIDVATVQSLEDVLWTNLIPFQFVQADASQNIIEPGNSLSLGMQVSADAAFVITSFVGHAYYTDDIATAPFLYINQENPQGNQNANGLVWQLNDENSNRILSSSDTPFETLGSARFPMKLEQPFMVWPSSRISLRLSNTRDDDRVFLAKVEAHGYRMRVPGALLSGSAEWTLASGGV